MATVSLALNGSARVAATTRARVEQIAKRLNYTPNAIARSLVSRKTNVIGLVLPTVSNPYFASVTSAVERAVRERGFNLVIANTDDDAPREEEALRLMRRQRVDGLIVTTASSDGASLGSILGSEFPTVLLGRTLEGFDAEFLIIDHEGGTREAVTHLIRHGRRRVAIITGPLRLSDARGRLSGYLNALVDRGIEKDEDLIVEGDFREEGGRVGVETLLSLRNPPDAVFISNGLMLRGALRALKSHDIEIPRQLAVIANDQSDWVDLLPVPVTTVEQPTDMMGTFAVDLLLRRISGNGEAHQRVVLKPALVVRESCGARAAERSI